MKNKLTGKDFLLLFLYLPGKSNQINEQVNGITRVTKAMFLLEKEVKKSLTGSNDIIIYPDFLAWNFGPWSKQVMDDLEFFQNIKFIICLDNKPEENIYTEEVKDYEKFNDFDLNINDQEESEGEEYKQKSFQLSEIGKKYVEEEILNNFSDNERKLISEFKKRINSLSLYAILEYVYKKYDTYTTKSEIKNKILKQ